MTHWRSDPEGAADQLIQRSLDDIAVRGRVLLASPSAVLPPLLANRAIDVTVWNRRAGALRPAMPWPPPGPFDLALLRLPKAKDEQEMAAHALLGVLADAGRLVVYGGNDEGIRSAAGMLEDLCGSVDTLATRGHGRVLCVHRPADVARLRVTLSAWRETAPISLGGTARDWVSYPGIFAGGRIDEGTALLLASLPPLAPGARVLDYGCGSGIIGAAALAQQPSLVLDLMDNDTIALEAARENVPGARTILGTRLADAGPAAYHAILSNPPLHEGIAEVHAHLEALIGDAPQHLQPGGLLQMVVQRRLPLERVLSQAFETVSIVSETGVYRVWRATTKTGSDPLPPRRDRQGAAGPGG